MSTTELTPDKIKAPETSRVEEPARQWGVMMKYTAPIPLTMGCAECLLKSVFKKSAEQAASHVQVAQTQGQDIVYTGTKDAVETKALEAELSKDVRRFTCTERMRFIQFVASPL